MDHLQLAAHTFSSRLILGTGKFSSAAVMLEAVKASGAQLVTVALRRFNREQLEDDLFGPLSELPGITLMPNTSGASTAAEAIKLPISAVNSPEVPSSKWKSTRTRST